MRSLRHFFNYTAFFIKMQYNTNSVLNKEFRKLARNGLIATSMDVITAITISYYYLVPAKLNTVLNTLYFVSVAYVQEHHAEFIVILRQVFEEIKEYLSVTGP